MRDMGLGVGARKKGLGVVLKKKKKLKQRRGGGNE